MRSNRNSHVLLVEMQYEKVTILENSLACKVKYSLMIRPSNLTLKYSLKRKTDLYPHRNL